MSSGSPPNIFNDTDLWLDPHVLQQAEDARRRIAKTQADRIKCFFSLKERREYSTVLEEGAPQLLKDPKTTTSLTSKVTVLMDESTLPGTLSRQLSVDSDHFPDTILVPHSKHLRTKSLPSGLGLCSATCSNNSNTSVTATGDCSNTNEVQMLQSSSCTSLEINTNQLFAISIGSSQYPSPASTVILRAHVDTSADDLIQLFLQHQKPGSATHSYKKNHCLGLFVTKNNLYEQCLSPEDRPILIQNKWLQEFGFQPADDPMYDLGSKDFSFYFHFWIAPLALHQQNAQDDVKLCSSFKTFSVPKNFVKSSMAISELQNSRTLSLELYNTKASPLELYNTKASPLELHNTRTSSPEPIPLLAPSPAQVSSMDIMVDVDLAGKNLYNFPTKQLINAANFRSLDLSHNRTFNLSLELCHACKRIESFHFSNNFLHSLPFSIIYFATTLSLLDLSMNFLREDSLESIASFVNLKCLLLQSNRLKTLPESFAAFKKLTYLNVSNNFMQRIPDVVCEMSALREVDFSYNLIVEIPAEIGKLKAMERLYLSNNLLRFLPDTISQLVNLQDVDLRNNMLEAFSLSQTSEHPHSLTNISLDGNCIKSCQFNPLPFVSAISITTCPLSSISFQCPMTSLTSLTLSNCKLSQLKENFFLFMPRLQNLILRNNSLTSLPASFELLVHLQTVDISHNQLDTVTFPPSPFLFEILINNNNIRTLHPCIWQLRELKRLVISSNLISTLPPFSPIASTNPIAKDKPDDSNSDECNTSSRNNTRYSNFLALEELYAAENNLSSAICFLFPHLPLLRVLNLSFNPKITQIHNISLLRNLEHLYLSGIGLLSVPFGIGMLQHLQSLYIDLNQISSIPGELAGCSQLNTLDVSCNLLKYNVNNVPYDWNWTLSPSLRYLSLAGNDSFTLQRIQSRNVTNEEMCNLQWLDTSGVAEVEANALSILHSISSSFTNDSCASDCETSTSNLSSQLHSSIFAFSQSAENCNTNSSRCCKVTAQYFSIANAATASSSNLNSSRAVRMFSAIGKKLSRRKVSISETDKMLTDATPHSANANSPWIVCMVDGGDEERVNYVISNFCTNLSEMIGMIRNEDDCELACRGDTSVDKNAVACDDDDLMSLIKRNVPSAIRCTFLECSRELCNLQSDSSESVCNSNRSEKIGNTAMNDSLSNQSAISLPNCKPGTSALMLLRIDNVIYSANVGACKAVLCRDGRAIPVSATDTTANAQEIWRIKCLGGYIDRSGSVGNTGSITKQLGNPTALPLISACPSIFDFKVDDATDEFVIIGSDSLWHSVSYQLAVDIVHRYRYNLQLAARRLRDYALGYGLHHRSAITVCIVSISNNNSNECTKGSHFNSQVNSNSKLSSTTASQLHRSVPLPPVPSSLMDVSLARLDSEISPPIGEVTIVFTDIKGSTKIWSFAPEEMKQALRIHNRIMRRLLRTIGGYEVKTEGDAFMVAFATVKQALKWCMQVQTELVLADWPSVIYEVPEAAIRTIQNISTYRGISVRMGMHVGHPLCELDPVTLRMDYFGLEVAIAARIRDLADGGQVFTTESVWNAARLLTADEERMLQDPRFFSVGKRQLKGVSEDVAVYAVYPESLQLRHVPLNTNTNINTNTDSNTNINIKANTDSNTIANTNTSSITSSIANTSSISSSNTSSNTLDIKTAIPDEQFYMLVQYIEQLSKVLRVEVEEEWMNNESDLVRMIDRLKELFFYADLIGIGSDDFHINNNDEIRNSNNENNFIINEEINSNEKNDNNYYNNNNNKNINCNINCNNCNINCNNVIAFNGERVRNVFKKYEMIFKFSRHAKEFKEMIIELKESGYFTKLFSD